MLGLALLAGGVVATAQEPLPIPATHYLVNDALPAPQTRRVALQTTYPAPGKPVTIDVLLLYTAAAQNHAGSYQQLTNTMVQALVDTRACFTNSGLENIQMRLVGIEKVNYTETSSMQTDLGRLATAGDGFLEEAQSLREAYGADMVSLFVKTTDPMVAGIGYVLVNNLSDMAYTVVGVQYFPGHVLTHELGHNFGCVHDRENANFPGYGDYSYGYRFTTSAGLMRTIMAYPPGTEVPFFSTPDRSYLGVPVGTDLQNNARTLRERAGYISSLRDRPSVQLTVQVHGSGSVLLNGNALSQVQVAPGTSLTLTAAPATGRRFVGWSWNGEAAVANPLNLTLADDVALEAYFDDAQPLAPVWVKQPPATLSVEPGANAILEAVAFGIPQPEYQWYRDGLPVAGASGTRLGLSSMNETLVGSYSVSAGNAAGNSTSRTIRVNLASDPLYWILPGVSFLEPGETLQFEVQARAALPVSYQWLFDEAELVGATNRTFLKPNLSSTDYGRYGVRIVTPDGLEETLFAELLPVAPPRILSQPEKLTVTVGQPARFQVTADGREPLYYQWRLNGYAIANATNRDYRIEAVSTNAAGRYSVVVRNLYGQTASTNATLIVNTPLTVTRQPTNTVVARGGTAWFYVTATGSDPITYQWYCNDEKLPNQVYSSCRITNVQPEKTGAYYVAITNPSGSLTSGEASLAMTDPPVITRPLQPLTTNEGAAAVFQLGVTGAQPMNFVWTFNGRTILTNQTPELRLPSVGRESEGLYGVLAANEDGTVKALDVRLTVRLKPTITTQPRSLAVNQGGTATFTVRQEGASPLTFQWLLNGSPLPGRTQQSLVLSPVETSMAGEYTIIVANDLGSVTSAPATLTVFEPPVLSPLPAALTGDEGGSLTLAVEAKGKQPMAYQWRRNGVDVPGATARSLTLSSLGLADEGTYTVFARNEDGSATSTGAALKVLTGPRLTKDLLPAVWKAGTTNALEVAATGATPLAYLWFKDGEPLAAASTNRLVFQPVRLGDEGEYHVTVSNRLGSVTSSKVTVQVQAPPVIVQPPASVVVATGGRAEFLVVASSERELHYQWKRNGTDLPGANANRLIIDPASSTAAGLYTVVVTNDDGQVESTAAQLSLAVPPSWTRELDDVSGPLGGTVELAAPVAGTQPMRFRWFFNRQELAGATNATLRLTGLSAEAEGDYQLVVDNLGGTITSRLARVTVLQPPQILVPPVSQAVAANGRATLAVQATGREPLQYQWSRNDVPVTGATSAALELSPVTSERTGTYRVKVRNADGEAVSPPATITLVTPPTLAAPLQNQTVVRGANVTFSVNASGPGSLQYRWYQGATLLPAATSATLTLVAVTTNAAGFYRVEVSNAGGTVNSTALLTVKDPPVIAVQPTSLRVRAGFPANLSVAATGREPLSYQWYRNGAGMAGQIGPSFLIPQASANDGAAYSVRITNPDGVITSQTAQVTVLFPPTITLQPADTRLTEGQAGSLRIETQGTAPMGCIWAQNGFYRAGGSNLLTFPAATPQDAGAYFVIVTNEVGWVVSRTAWVTVSGSSTNTTSTNSTPSLTGPVIRQNPQAVTAPLGSTAVFQATVSSDIAFRAVWYFGDRAIQTNDWGVTASANLTLSLPSVQLAQAGNYQLRLTSTIKNVESPWTTLTITQPPVIVEEPADLVINEHDTAQIHARVEGKPPMRYQWFKDGLPLTKGNESQYTISTATLSDQGLYFIQINNDDGVATSKTVRVRLRLKPVIVSQPPETVTAALGTALNLTVTAQGDAPLSYQWFKNGQAWAGRTAATLGFPSVALADAATYRVEVSNLAGTAISRDIRVSISQPPIITQDPASLVVVNGGRASFSVETSGLAPFQYQWLYAGSPISGATARTLVLDPVQPRQAGRYAVRVTNADGTATSRDAQLTVQEAPCFLVQPLSQRVLANSVVTLEVQVGGTQPLQLFWLKDGQPIDWATNSQLRFLAGAEALGGYWVVASNLVGVTTSEVAVVSFRSPPLLTVPPRSIVTNETSTVVFRAEVLGSDLSYQWYKDGALLTGFDQELLVLQNVQPLDEGDYTVKVWNPDGFVISPPARLSVRPLPVITRHPAVVIRTIHTPAELSVEAVSLTPMKFQWFRDGVPVAGATNAVFALEDALDSASGGYTVEVSNDVGRVSSEVGTLLVLPVQPVMQPDKYRETQVLAVLRGHKGASLLFVSYPGRRYRVLASDDLVNWQRISTISANSHTTQYDDGEQAHRRFYRVEPDLR